MHAVTSSSSYFVDTIKVVDKLNGKISIHFFDVKDNLKRYQIKIANVLVRTPSGRFHLIFEQTECEFEKVDKFIRLTLSRDNKSEVDYIEYDSFNKMYIAYHYKPCALTVAKAKELLKKSTAFFPSYEVLTTFYNRMGVVALTTKDNLYFLIFTASSDEDDPEIIIPTSDSHFMTKGKTKVESTQGILVFTINSPKDVEINYEKAIPLK